MPLVTLRKSINKVGILVPLLVYEKDSKPGRFVILDGERRWRCAQELFEDTRSKRFNTIPANVIDEPSIEQNILTMFNIHNVREEWELMPTAKKLEVLMKSFGTKSETELSKLTGLTPSQVKRCKILISLPNKYQDMMLRTDPAKRIKADLFIEMDPVINLFKKNFKPYSDKYTKGKLIRIFYQKYIHKVIKNVLHFRKLAEILRGTKTGFPRKKALKVIQNILENQNVGIENFEDVIKEHNASKTVKNSIIKILPLLNLLDIIDIGNDKKFVALLEKLKILIDDKLDDIEKNISNL